MNIVLLLKTNYFLTFSPNNDGINDIFEYRYNPLKIMKTMMHASSFVESINLQIFNK